MKENLSSLWSPDEELKERSNLNRFCKILSKNKYLEYDQNFNKLWKWSVNNPEIFWSEVWDFTQIKGIKGKKILKKNKIFYKNSFFPEAKLNYAENLICKKDKSIAVNFLSENGSKKKLHGKIYMKKCANSLVILKN